MKEPLYKRWWMWIMLFLIIASIVNAREATSERPSSYYNYETAFALSETAITNDYDIECMSPTLDCPTPHTLLVGIDIEPGEYFIEAKENALAYFQLARDHSGSLDQIITNRNFKTHTFITVEDGQALTIYRATITKADAAMVPAFINGILKDGVYRIGIDIPAGTYTLRPTTNVAGFYQVASSSRQIPADILSQQNFSEDMAITVIDGQYLTLIRAQLLK